MDCLATSKNPILLFKVIAGENVANWKSDKPIFVLTEEKMGQKKLESSETLKYSFVRKDNDKKCHVSTPKWDKKDCYVKDIVANPRRGSSQSDAWMALYSH